MVERMSVFSGDTEGIAGRYGMTGITWEAQMDNVRSWSVMLLWVSSHLYFWAHHFKFYALPCWNQVVWCVTKRFTSKSEAAVQVSVVTKASYCFQKHEFAIQCVARSPPFSLSLALSLWPAHLSHFHSHQCRMLKGNASPSSVPANGS